MVLLEVHEKAKEHGQVLLDHVVARHLALHLTLHLFAARLGPLIDLLVIGWCALVQKQRHDVVGRVVHHNQVQRGIGAVVLLAGRLEVRVV